MIAVTRRTSHKINSTQIKSKLTYNTNTILGSKAPITPNDVFIIHKAPKNNMHRLFMSAVKSVDGNDSHTFMLC